MIDGLKLKLHASEIESGLTRELERLDGILKKFYRPGSSIVLAPNSTQEREAQAARLEIARLTFIKDHLIDNETYYLGWGDVSSLGVGFYTKVITTEAETEANKRADDGSNVT